MNDITRRKEQKHGLLFWSAHQPFSDEDNLRNCFRTILKRSGFVSSNDVKVKPLFTGNCALNLESLAAVRESSPLPPCVDDRTPFHRFVSLTERKSYYLLIPACIVNSLGMDHLERKTLKGVESVPRENPDKSYKKNAFRPLLNSYCFLEVAQKVL